MYSQTDILHDGVLTPQGTQVDPSEFGEAAEGLIEAGVLGELPPGLADNPVAAQEIMARDERIAELEARLAEAGVSDEPDDDDE